MMRVEHFGGTDQIRDAAGLCELLKKRYGDDVNEFFISGEDLYPLLSILVRGSVACLHFFPQADHPGFISVGAKKRDGVLVFYTNTPTEEIEVDARAGIPFEQAQTAAKEFLELGSMPAFVQWKEL